MVLHQNSWFIPLGVHLPKMGVSLTETGSARTIYLELYTSLKTGGFSGSACTIYS